MTALQTLKESIEDYQRESGNDVISIELLKQGIDGIYGHLEKKQIIGTAIEFGMHGAEMMQHYGEEYYNIIKK